eukprot:scaffold295555_cov28-Tisochrysis_lutea.AAC.8
MLLVEYALSSVSAVATWRSPPRGTRPCMDSTALPEEAVEQSTVPHAAATAARPSNTSASEDHTRQSAARLSRERRLPNCRPRNLAWPSGAWRRGSKPASKSKTPALSFSARDDDFRRKYGRKSCTRWSACSDEET